MCHGTYEPGAKGFPGLSRGLTRGLGVTGGPAALSRVISDARVPRAAQALGCSPNLKQQFGLVWACLGLFGLKNGLPGLSWGLTSGLGFTGGLAALSRDISDARVQVCAQQDP